MTTRRAQRLREICPVLLLLCSCATSSPEISSLPKFDSIAIINASTFAELDRPERESERIEKGIKTGAVVGSLGGAVVGASACGPVLYGACVIGFGAYGFMAGTFTGVAYGHYSFAGLSTTDIAYLDEVMSRLEHERNLGQELSKQLELRIPSDAMALPESADIQVVVRLEHIEFSRDSKDFIRSKFVASMVLAWQQGQGSATYARQFAAESPAEDIDELIADDGKRFAVEIDRCFAQLASEMSAVLLQLRADPDAGSLQQ